MNVKLVRAWIENNSPPLDDLAPAIGMSLPHLIDVMRGYKFPDQGTKELLARVFERKVDELFD